MMPVERTRAWSSSAPQAAAASRAISSASSSPRSPVQALALPELTTTARIRSLGVRLAVERHRRGEDEVLRVDARRHGRRLGHDQRQVVLVRIALDPQ